MTTTRQMTTTAKTRQGWLMYRTRDLRLVGDPVGSGIEEGTGEYVYRDFAWGKHRFDPVDGGPSLYLFYDEIIDWLTPGA